MQQTTWGIRSMQYFGAHSLPFLIMFLLFIFLPAGRTLRRTGHNSLWCVLALFPVLNLIGLWFFAFKTWPTDKKPIS